MLKFPRLINIAAVSMVALVAACASQTPLDTYSLSSSAVAVAQNRKNVQILVPTPAALKALDSENIVIHNVPGSITYLKGAQWGDRLTNLVQARLVQAFENSNAVGGVGRPGDGLAINYQVQVDLRDFGITASSSPQMAKIELAVRVLNDKTGEVRATRVFSSTAPVSGTGNNAYVRALDTGFSDVTRQIVAWVVSTI